MTTATAATTTSNTSTEAVSDADALKSLSQLPEAKNE
jgi:NAD(P)H-hydrate repair Nnr-like enzyme with NAD(P)H-hydrate dehydratase domain